MWMPLCVVMALSVTPGEAGQLSLDNARFTYGVLGPTRSAGQFLPGDEAVLSFDIHGLQTNDDGRGQASVGLEVLDSNGTVRFKQKPRKLEVSKSLGGDTVQGVASIEVGLDQPAGEYALKVTVMDGMAHTQASLNKKVEVLPAGLGVVRAQATADADGRIPASAWGVGQSAWINALAVGFTRDNGQPNVLAELRVVDENGQPTTAKPYSGVVNKGIPAKARALPLRFLLELNRSGSFTVELKVRDKVSGKESTVRFPLRVANQG